MVVFSCYFKVMLDFVCCFLIIIVRYKNMIIVIFVFVFNFDFVIWNSFKLVIVDSFGFKCW